MLITFTVSAVAQGEGVTKESLQDLDTLTTWMQGTFSSEQHSRHDSSYKHFVMHIRRIWPERTDGIWFHSKGALASDTSNPAHGITHVLALPEGMFEMTNYRVPGVSGAGAGVISDADIDALDPTALKKNIGCEIYMQFSGQAFFGSSHGFACKTIPGASYTTTTVEIRSYGMMIWERGYSETDELIEGPEKGGYVFERQ